MSAGSRRGCSKRSLSRSIASGRSSPRTLAYRQVFSREVKASSVPPTLSMAWAISSALRLSVPLNSRCSMKWDTPARSAGSFRDPTFTHTPMDTERTWGIRSVRTTMLFPSTSFL